MPPTAPRRRPLVSSCLVLSRFPDYSSFSNSFFFLAFIILHQSLVPPYSQLLYTICPSSRKMSTTSPTGTSSGRRTVTGRAKIVRRARRQRVPPKVGLSTLLSSSTHTISFTSQGSLPCTLQVLQGGLLYCRGLVSLLPRE